MRKNSSRVYIMRDLGIVALSVVIAVILAKTEILKTFLVATQETKILGSFFSGMFFTSVFTTAPATVVLAELAQSNSVFLVALFGALGAMLGDLVIFGFIKDYLAEDILHLLRGSGYERFSVILKLKLFRWFIPFIGALIIASPLPDELGLVMLGLSKTRTKFFILISLTFNFLGILVIGFVARSLGR